ncbi:MAG: Fis family transcriptional regulator [Deltaproteobacteria bacterium HGW-Deltaproteobacteria-15]|nr:MAG: Fis family transcriptional regulator [Deltaproteobacteria bacterium HGW-Deltaproteobacteria-15]
MDSHERDFFYQSTVRICSSLEIEKGLYGFYKFLEQFMPVEAICLCLFEPDMGALKTLAEAREAGGRRMDAMIPLSLEARSILEREDLERVRVDNSSDGDPILEDWAHFFELPESSFLRLRLVVEGKKIGSLVMHAAGRNRYSEENARWMSLLNEPFAIAISNALRHREALKLRDMLADENRYLRRELQGLSGDEIVGSDFGLKGTMEMARQVAPLESPVLLLGESGAGKELIANAIHQLSTRRDGPFIVVNCGAIPETLLDSELFGHEKGAFTGAMAQKKGRFERANRGTIFLDEIGELPLQAQVRMLRVLQNMKIERVGGTEPIPVDIRVIAATHRDLEKMMLENRFREDLWFRLNVFPITIPPLRERRADIPALVHYFVEKKSIELKLPSSPKLAPGAIDQLVRYNWPGNVRELANVIERALILNRNGNLVFDRLVNIPKPVTEDSEERNSDVLELNAAMARHIRQALAAANGKVHGPGGAAQLLGINPSTLRNRMNKLSISYGRHRNNA